MKLRPLGKNLVLKKIEEKEETTKGGIVLPDSAREENDAVAEIVAIGPKIEEKDKYKEQISIGDRVIYSKYSGTSVELDDEEYTIVKIEDILAVIE